MGNKRSEVLRWQKTIDRTFPDYHGIHRIFVGRRDGVDVIAIGFAADAFSRVVTEEKGAPGTGQPKDRLDKIQSIICSQLRVQGTFELGLVFKMLSELNYKPEWKTVLIPQISIRNETGG